MKNVVFVGTCQAMALQSLYNSYIRADNEPFAYYISSNEELSIESRSTLAGAGTIVTQKFTNNQRLTINQADYESRIIEFPYMSGLFLWPYASEAHLHRKFVETVQFAPYDEELGDAFINRLLRRSVPPEDCLSEYLEIDFLKVSHAERRAELVWDQQYKRDRSTGINAGEFIQKHFQTDQLFMTRGHLARSGLLFLCKEVFSRMGVGDDGITRVENHLIQVPDHRNYAAIHPQIASFFKLAYAKPDRLYEQYYGNYSFNECILRYAKYEFNEDVIRGIHAEAVGQFDLAVALLRPITDRLELIPHAFFGLGKALHGLGKDDEALGPIQIAAENSPADPYMQIIYGQQLRTLGKYKEAEACLLNASERFPNFSPIWETVSHVQASMKNFADAVTSIENAVAQSAQRRPKLRHLGNLYLNVDRPEDAYAAFLEATLLFPGEAWCFRSMAEAKLALGQLEAAKTCIEKAIEIEPKNISFLYFLAEIIKRQDEYLIAIQIYEKIIKIDKNSVHAYSELSHLYLRNGEMERALDCAVNVSKLEPDNAGNLRHLLSLLTTVGKLDDAIIICVQYTRRFPDSIDGHIRLAELAEFAGHIQFAIYATSIALRLDPDNRNCALRLARLEG